MEPEGAPRSPQHPEPDAGAFHFRSRLTGRCRRPHKGSSVKTTVVVRDDQMRSRWLAAHGGPTDAERSAPVIPHHAAR